VSLDPKIDLRVCELLASRLCHDLVGPIGAVNNGMELMSDEELGMADDAMGLASRSAAQAADILQFFRLAYGVAGARVEGGFATLRQIAQRYLGHHKAALDWATAVEPPAVPDDAGKLILNLVALAGEGLPRGGQITVNLAQAVPPTLEVIALGADAGLRDEVALGLSEEISAAELTPRGVHGYFTQCVARRLGGTVAVEMPDEDVLRFAVALRAEN
jgi:histidine phosphotransferase ChpT